MRGVIIDYRSDEKICARLKSLGFDVIKSAENKCVSPYLSGHPDMQICKCTDDTFVCAPNCYEYYKFALAPYDVNILCGNTELECNYPMDIAYNVACVGNIAIHNFKYTDSVLNDYFLNIGAQRINVKQGYSKCNVCVVGKSGVITSDIGIYKQLLAAEIDVLLIDDGYISIFGWNSGFIGGASGMLNDEILAFCGDIRRHPNYPQIEKFCSEHGVTVISLFDGELTDYGSLVSCG